LISAKVPVAVVGCILHTWIDGERKSYAIVYKSF